MRIGIAEIQVHIPEAQTLKDKRAVLNSFKKQIRNRFNVAIAEIDPNEKWQRTTLGMAVIGQDHCTAESQIRQIAEWVRACRIVELIRLEQEYV